jgi:hypothetical protein
VAVTPYQLRSAVAEALWKYIGSPNLPAVCVSFGLEAGDEQVAYGRTNRAALGNRTPDLRITRTPSRVDSRSDQELWLHGRHL